MKTLVAALCFTLLTAFGGCTTTPTTPVQTVFAAKQSYALALTVAVAYRKLPVCSPTAPPLCSKPEIVVILQKTDIASSAMLDAAEHIVRFEGAGANVDTALRAATEAVGVFSKVTSQLAVK